MKENKLVNIIIIMVVVFMFLFIAKGTVSADDNNNANFINLTGTITNGNNTATPGNNTTNNATNNQALPNTGIESSISGVILVVILGISAVYAYNKIQDYKNI